MTPCRRDSKLPACEIHTLLPRASTSLVKPGNNDAQDGAARCTPPRHVVGCFEPPRGPQRAADLKSSHGAVVLLWVSRVVLGTTLCQTGGDAYLRRAACSYSIRGRACAQDRRHPVRRDAFAVPTAQSTNIAGAYSPNLVSHVVFVLSSQVSTIFLNPLTITLRRLTALRPFTTPTTRGALCSTAFDVPRVRQ